VVLINLSDQDFVVQHGERIAQMVINQYTKIEFEEVELLTSTIRGEGGFGHTGKN
jgi:dUTP pyrophosphatase